MNTFLRLATTLTAAGFILGCTNDAGERSIALPQASAVPTAEQYVPRPEEALFAALARDIPGTAGFFQDTLGNIVAWSKDLSKESEIHEWLLSRSDDLDRPLLASRSLLVRKADFDFFQLASWRDRAVGPIVTTPGVSYIDLREGTNRIEIGYSDPKVYLELLAKLGELGIPQAAVTLRLGPQLKLESRDPNTFTCTGTTLDSCYRPLRGGLVIDYPFAPGDGLGCTLGVLVANGGAFLTASHCTSTLWGLDNQLFYQNDASDSDDYIGYELSDISPYSCYSGYWCRNSEATVYAIDGTNASSDFGYISRTTAANGGNRNGGSGSKVIDTSISQFRIAADHAFLLENMRVEKIGRATGWTSGTVKSTCIDTGHAQYYHGIVVCQDRATYWSDDGDSGSPVIDWASGNYDTFVIFSGVHWASTGGTDTTDYAVFSPISRIKMDYTSIETYPIP